MPVSLIKITWRNLIRHPWQSALMIVGITLGVAVAVAIDLANVSAARAFDLSTEAIAGKATHFITGIPSGIDEKIYTELRRSAVPVEMAPVITAYISSPQLGANLYQLLGIDAFADAPFRNYLSDGESNKLSSSELVNFLTRPGAVFISSQTASQYGLEPGDSLNFEFDGKQIPAFVAGLLQPKDSLSGRALNTIILVDLATAQEITGRYGKIDRIDLLLPVSNREQLSELISSILPRDVRLLPAEARSGSVEQMTAAFRVNLTALSLLALVVGLFLIYNTMTFSVVQRRPLFGTLRCLGVTRKEVFLIVVGEALVVGVFGAVLGTGLGIIMGQGAVRLVTRTINDLFFVVTVQGVQIPNSSLLKGVILGVLTTVLTAAPPAWEAATVPPRHALSRSGLESKARKAVFLAACYGVLLCIIGGGIFLLPVSNLVVSFIATFAVITGFALLTPITALILAECVSPLTGKIWGVLGHMAPRNVVNSLSRTAVAVSALMVAISVAIGVSVMVSSFRYTVELWLEQVLQGDIYISAPTLIASQTSAPVDPQVIDLLWTYSQIENVYMLRSVNVDSPRGSVHIAASSNYHVADERMYVLKDTSVSDIEAEMAQGAVIVSEPFANRLGFSDQNRLIELYTNQGVKQFRVIGIYYDYASTQGTVLMSLDVYRKYWSDDVVTSIALRLRPNHDPDLMANQLRDKLNKIQALQIRPNQILRSDVMEVFDRTFAITGALQLLATVVAFIGVLSALLSLELERQRELGILRSIGMTARQLWGLVIIETGLLGSIAGLLAMPTGYMLSLILVYIINKRSFGWTLQMQVVPEPFVQAFLIAVVAALLAGFYPAYRMGKMITADAMRYE